MRENMSSRKCHIGLDALKFSSAKISTFTVFHYYRKTTNSSHGLIKGYFWKMGDMNEASIS